MKPVLLNSLQKKWQEYVFIITIGFLLFEIIKFNLTQTEMDFWDLSLLAMVLPLFIGLIGQLRWDNEILSMVLSLFLSIGSLIIILMSVYFIVTTSTKMGEAISMLALGIFLLFTSISMSMRSRRRTTELT